MKQSERIRALNDRLRTRGIGGGIVATRGIRCLTSHEQAMIFEAIQCFDQFDPENDPYGEHDFGSLMVGDNKVIFKIDYYDRELVKRSPDPSNGKATARILTVMLAEEY